jgi:hypothetical protein
LKASLATADVEAKMIAQEEIAKVQSELNFKV